MSDSFTQPVPQTEAEDEAALLQLLVEMQHLREQMDNDQADIERLKAETRSLKAETRALLCRTGFNWHRFGHAILADGSESTFNIFEGVVLWDGQPVTIRIDELDADSLVGMSLMYGYELVLPVLDGATFTLRRITNP